VGAHQLVDLLGVVRVVGRVAYHHHVHGGACVHLRILVRWLNVLSMVLLVVSVSRNKVVVVVLVVMPHLM
jgi:hypothetical protein